MDREHLTLLDDMRQTSLEALLHVDAATDPDPTQRRIKQILCEDAPALRVVVGSLMLMRVLAKLRGMTVADLLTASTIDPETPTAEADGYALLLGVMRGLLNTEDALCDQHGGANLKTMATRAVRHEVALVAGLRGMTHRGVVTAIREAVLSAQITGPVSAPHVSFPAVENIPQS